jgi:hypothetical protein
METREVIKQQTNGQPYILHKSMISDDLREDILDYYNKLQII